MTSIISVIQHSSIVALCFLLLLLPAFNPAHIAEFARTVIDPAHALLASSFTAPGQIPFMPPPSSLWEAATMTKTQVYAASNARPTRGVEHLPLQPAWGKMTSSRKAKLEAITLQMEQAQNQISAATPPSVVAIKSEQPATVAAAFEAATAPQHHQKETAHNSSSSQTINLLQLPISSSKPSPLERGMNEAAAISETVSRDIPLPPALLVRNAVKA